MECRLGRLITTWWQSSRFFFASLTIENRTEQYLISDESFTHNWTCVRLPNLDVTPPHCKQQQPKISFFNQIVMMIKMHLNILCERGKKKFQDRENDELYSFAYNIIKRSAIWFNGATSWLWNMSRISHKHFTQRMKVNET